MDSEEQNKVNWMALAVKCRERIDKLKQENDTLKRCLFACQTALIEQAKLIPKENND